jgi:DNA-binding SARP family transcriptional activator/DNA-binding HxlR family transcriptional regulator
MACNAYRAQNCAVARAIDAVSEPLSPVIVQEALINGTTAVRDFALRLEIDPAILLPRLNGLVNSGLMEAHPDLGIADQPEYLLTKRGRDLAPSMIALAAFGDRWASSETPSAFESEKWDGRVLDILVSCESCDRQPTSGLAHTDAGAVDEVLVALLDSEHIPSQPVIASPIPHVEISVLGTFSVRIDGEIIGPLSVGTQRILAYLALHDRAVTRLSMAGTMWPDVSEQHAAGSLRSALARLDEPTRDAIVTASAGLRFDDHVSVDFRHSQSLAHRLLELDAVPGEADLDSDAIALLSLDLLPDWYDDWVVAEAEDWRNLRRNALEAQADFLTASERWSEAAEAAQAAVRIDPLRESTQACLIRVHLATGNQSEALKAFYQYRSQLMAELGIEPTAQLTELVRSIRKK